MPTARRIGPLCFPLAVFCVTTALACLATAADRETAEFRPRIAPASDEPIRAMRSFQLPEGFEVELFAAEPHLANPVAFWIDLKGRVYVAETFRVYAGVTDTRRHMYWLDDDLASRTVEDRVAMYRKHLGEKFDSYAVNHDRLRLVEDTDGDGRADRATVFADGFHSHAEGIGAGVISRGNSVWYACIPNLWLLEDTNGDGRADNRRSLHYGYGVHVGFYGHDLHGLRFGPDGKLYFSIGDRGLNVETEGRRLFYPDTGVVLRCNPDGSELEVFATGLRNPQELALDQYGNLFTCDNNSDSGDRARVVYLVEGGDSGWRIGYQFITEPVPRGPWNAEKLWHPQWDGQPAYIVPPLANLGDGPSGLAYYPGTGLPQRYGRHFFICDFRGTRSLSGVRSFALRTSGASFEVIDGHKFLWNLLATDVDFGPDGAMYVSDWVDGWELTGKGRIYKFFDPRIAKSPDVLEVRRLLTAGMARRGSAELAGLLEHADMRVRQEAQFTLSARGADEALTRVAQGEHQLARLHAIWGLGQIGRKDTAVLEPLVALLDDDDDEVRAQAAKVLGEARLAAASAKLIALLKDESPRARFFAAMALGKGGGHEAVGPVLEMLRENADRDPYLRHAGVMALCWINDSAALRAAAADPDPSVRMGVLLAWRRLESVQIHRFLEDPDLALVIEAARAIYDVPIEAALPELAATVDRAGLPQPAVWRATCANFRLGGEKHARALADFAARAEAPEGLRLEALRMLGEWAAPSGRDRVTGLWRPLEPRSAEVAAGALRPTLGGIFAGPAALRQLALETVAVLGMEEVTPALFELLSDRKLNGQTRAEALRALGTLNGTRLSSAIELALADADPLVRVEGLRLLARLEPARAAGPLETALQSGALVERQSALRALGQMRTATGAQLLSAWLDKLLAGDVPGEIQLDLVEAAAKYDAGSVKEKLARYRASLPKDDPLAEFRVALEGGDAERGRRIFFDWAQVSCLKCHKIDGRGGEVGPDLSDIGAQQKRAYLLEAIITPNQTIAKGFDTLAVETADGHVHVGVVKDETGEALTLMTAEARIITVPKSQVENRSRARTAMPDDVVKLLSKSQLRDLVEFLAGRMRTSE